MNKNLPREVKQCQILQQPHRRELHESSRKPGFINSASPVTIILVLLPGCVQETPRADVIQPQLSVKESHQLFSLLQLLRPDCFGNIHFFFVRKSNINSVLSWCPPTTELQHEHYLLIWRSFMTLAAFEPTVDRCSVTFLTHCLANIHRSSLSGSLLFYFGIENNFNILMNCLDKHRFHQLSLYLTQRHIKPTAPKWQDNKKIEKKKVIV